MTHAHTQEATAFLRTKIGDFNPQIGIILGTGLSGVAAEIEVIRVLNFAEIPHFPVPTTGFHEGKLIFGILSGKKVVCMQGRLHYYEGFSMKQITFPVRVMKALGIDYLVVSNASGGLNPSYKAGDLMLIRDHISVFMPENPLTGPYFEEMGERFPDMCDAYDPKLITQAEEIAFLNGIELRIGTYAIAPGPQLQTRAEYRLLRTLGADAVGMSTVPEVMVARQLGITCFGLSVITDMGLPEMLRAATLTEVMASTAKAEPAFRLIVKDLLYNLGIGQDIV